MAIPVAPPAPRGGAFLLGFALSGFFDGVLLHQILQWHHLLGALDGDLRFQVAADGWFHAGMYVVAALGLWRLWRGRAGLVATVAGPRVAGWALLGFGAWHALDAVGSHWILGIHRIRMDAANPLLWDLGWLAVFGLIPAATGAAILRRPGRGRGRAAAVVLVAGATTLGAWALRPPEGVPLTTVAFASGVGAAEAAKAVAGAGGTLVWSDGAGVAVATGLDLAAAWRLYADGALYVGGGVLPDGCLAWRG